MSVEWDGAIWDFDGIVLRWIRPVPGGEERFLAAAEKMGYLERRMDGTGSQDSRPATNHKGWHAHGYYMEEGTVYADDGTVLGFMRTSVAAGRPQPEGMVFGRVDIIREDMIRAMRLGAQL